MIYYHFDEEEIVYLLLAYPKSASDDLTKEQLGRLKKIIE